MDKRAVGDGRRVGESQGAVETGLKLSIRVRSLLSSHLQSPVPASFETPHITGIKNDGFSKTGGRWDFEIRKQPASDAEPIRT